MTQAWEEHDARHQGCSCASCDDRSHNERRPHWSVGIVWPVDRWDPVHTAPSKGYPILYVRGRRADGAVIDRMHYAHGGGEEQPAFRGWFAPYGCKADGFYEVTPVEWQPLEVVHA